MQTCQRWNRCLACLFCIARSSFFSVPLWRTITEIRRAFRLWSPAKGQADYCSFCTQAPITKGQSHLISPSQNIFRNLTPLRRSQEAWRTGYLCGSCLLVLSCAAVPHIAVWWQRSARSYELPIFCLGEILPGVQHMGDNHLITWLPLHTILVWTTCLSEDAMGWCSTDPAREHSRQRFSCQFPCILQEVILRELSSPAEEVKLESFIWRRKTLQQLSARRGDKHFGEEQLLQCTWTSSNSLGCPYCLWALDENKDRLG